MNTTTLCLAAYIVTRSRNNVVQYLLKIPCPKNTRSFAIVKEKYNIYKRKIYLLKFLLMLDSYLLGA